MKKKILFLSHSAELYGAEMALLQTIDGLNKKEFHPILVLPRTGPLREAAEKLAVETLLVPSKWWMTEKDRIWKQPLSWFWNIKSVVRIGRLIKQKGIHLVYTNSTVNFSGALAAKWKRIPHVWSIHEILGTKNAALRFLLGNRILLSLVSALSTGIIVNSEATGHPFGKRKKVRIVPIGFKWSHGDRGLRQMLRQKFGFKPTDYVIGIVGKIYPEKGQQQVVESIGLVKKNDPEVKLLVVGEVKNTGYFNRMQQYISSAGLEGHVRFTGYQQDIYGVLTLLDLLVIASCVESFGRVAVEAMSVKTPVLAVRKGALSEIITAGETGFLVDSPDPAMLAEAILSIRANPELTRKVVEEGFRDVREKYTVGVQMKRTEEVIRECLGPEGDGG